MSRIHQLGGSVLLTSRANPSLDPADLERVVETLEALGIGYLTTIGGDDMCYSAKFVAEAANGRIRVVHVPKTIDNDLPLPGGIPTFGFETARAAAAGTLGTLPVTDPAPVTLKGIVVELVHFDLQTASVHIAKSRGRVPGKHLRHVIDRILRPLIDLRAVWPPDGQPALTVMQYTTDPQYSKIAEVITVQVAYKDLV